MRTLKMFLVTLAIAAIAIVFWRCVDYAKCGVASYDLQRSTEYSWVTGNCMIERANGERIYLKQLRGMDGSD